MNELQIRLLDILKWFHTLCEKEALTYYAAGGTTLGAVRHGGFIPWDDDIDIIMPRPDYERFLEISADISENKKYVVEFPGINSEYTYPYAKIYDTGTLLVENTWQKLPRGIYIDVFPMDGIGNNYEESVRNFKKVDSVRNLLLARTCALNSKRSILRNISIIAGRAMFWINTVNLAKSINDKCKKLSYADHDYIANIMGAWHLKEIMKKSWLGKPTLRKFEDTEIYCPENCDAYLKQLYGDYMKLPPPEKRVRHHSYLKIDLNKSFLR